MKSSSKSRGLTLVELIITIAIFGGFTLLLTVLVINSIRGYQRGRVYQAVREQTSTMVKKMAEDIKLAYPPPTLGTGSWIPSGIALPNPYGTANSNANGDIGNGIGQNRVVIFSPKDNLDEFDIENPMKNGESGEQQLKFVEYVFANESNVKRIRRNTYTIPKPGTTSTYGPYKRSGSQWLITSQSMGTLERSEIILELTDPNDEIWFQVESPKLIDPELAYGTTYDRHLLEITARMTRYVQGNKNIPIVHEEKTQVQTSVK